MHKICNKGSEEDYEKKEDYEYLSSLILNSDIEFNVKPGILHPNLFLQQKWGNKNTK